MSRGNLLGASEIRVLVVDDFEPWRRCVCSAIQKQNSFRVIGEASDGLEAIQKTEQLHPDLVLLDIGLPKLNGIEAAHRINQLVPTTKILFASAMSDPEVVATALLNGANGYILKSEVGADLLLALDTVIHGERFLSARLKR